MATSKRRGKHPVSFPEAYANVANDLMQRIGDAQAAQMGPPTSTEDKVKPAANADRVEAWNARNPEATDGAMMRMAAEQFQKHLAQGMDPKTAERATAEDLTHFRYSQRMKIYTYGMVGFREQVEAAQRLAKLAAREHTPDPPPPSPTMPSAAMTNAATLGMEQAPAAPADPLAAGLGQSSLLENLAPAPAAPAPSLSPATPPIPEYPPGGVL